MNTPNAYRFRWTSSYQFEVDYEAVHEGQLVRLSVRDYVPTWLREHYAGMSDAEFAREVVATVGLLRWHSRPMEAPPAALVDAFNAWRAAEHGAQLAKLTSEPERYGTIAPDDPIRNAPPVLRGGLYVIGKGWRAAPEQPELWRASAADGRQECDRCDCLVPWRELSRNGGTCDECELQHGRGLAGAMFGEC